MRRLLGTSVLTVLVVTAVIMGTSIALAITVELIDEENTLNWDPTAEDPSGIAHLDGTTYLVVDTNADGNNADTNGWLINPGFTSVVNVGSGVDEPTGVDYDATNDRLFVTSDRSPGFITVINNYPNNPSALPAINVPGGDTEDPAWDGEVLYWVDGVDERVRWIDPVDGVFGNGNDQISPNGVDVSPLNTASNADWEALTWDPVNEVLLLGNTRGEEIYLISIDRQAGTYSASEDSIDLSAIDGGFISGLALGPGSSPGENSLWVTDREQHRILEFSYDGTVSPTTTTTVPDEETTTTVPDEETTTTVPDEETTTTVPDEETTTTTLPDEETTTTSIPGGGTTTTTTQPTPTTTTPGGGTTTTTPPGNPGPGPGPEFSDTVGHTFETAISWLADEGITQGCNPPANSEFCPDDPVTRGQMAAFLVRAFGYSNSGTGDYFDDTPGNTFETDIDRLRVAGITQGCNPPTNNRYCPDDLVTRGQMAAFLGRAFDYTDAGSGNYFMDTAGNTFKTDIDRLRVAGVTLGCNPPTNNRYCPNDFVTRGQLAAFLQRGFGE